MKTAPNPFLDPAPKEIHLRQSPLVKVIAQVQYPAQLRLAERATIGALQATLGELFPVLEEQNLQTMVFDFSAADPSGKVQRPPQISPNIQPQWRFSHPETGEALQINTTSITYETSKYTSRLEFFAKFEKVLLEIQAQSPITLATRLGVRYVDRIPHTTRQGVETLLQHGFGGISSLGLGLPVTVDLCEFQVEAPKEMGTFHGRVGYLPPGGTFDPIVLPPLAEGNWILDLDLFRMSSPAPFRYDPRGITRDASSFALRIYSVFRWMVTDDFLRAFGGEI